MNVRELEKSAYERINLPEAFGDIAEFMSEVYGSIAKFDIPVQASAAIDTVREQLWTEGSDSIRGAMATGSIAIGSWPGSGGTPARARLYFNSPDKLRSVITATAASELGTTALQAVATQYRASAVRYVPEGFVPWATSLSTVADDQQHARIIDSLSAVEFTHHHIDSEDMESPHDIDRFLQDEKLSFSLRKRLLEVALADAHNTRYKPWAWQSQIETTLRGLANNMQNSLRFQARSDLGLPVSDDDYQSFIDRKAAERAAKQAERDSERQAEQNHYTRLAAAAISRMLTNRNYRQQQA